MIDSIGKEYIKLLIINGVILGLIIALTIGLSSWFLWLFCK